jgi:hypothetical protein
MPPSKRNHPHKSDNPEQSKRFIDMAREVDVDETNSAFDKAFDSLAIKNEGTSPSGKSRMGKRDGRRET